MTENTTQAAECLSRLTAELDTIKEGDTIICLIDEWGDGKKEQFAVTVLFKEKDGFNVCYLSGYRSRNDTVPFCDVVAKLDMKMPVVNVGAFEGHFKVFNHSV